MQELIKLQAATLAARARTGNKTIATSVQSGMVRVESVTYNTKGTSTVNAMSGDLTIDQAIEVLNAL